jgi:hypothetical protein
VLEYLPLGLKLKPLFAFANPIDEDNPPCCGNSFNASSRVPFKIHLHRKEYELTLHPSRSIISGAR